MYTEWLKLKKEEIPVMVTLQYQLLILGGSTLFFNLHD